MLLVGIVIAGCILLASLRRVVYGRGPVDTGAARQHPAEDPLLARELHIGRPDVAKDDDDGGLVDLNHASVDANVDELFVKAELPVATWDSIRDRAVLLP